MHVVLESTDIVEVTDEYGETSHGEVWWHPITGDMVCLVGKPAGFLAIRRKLPDHIVAQLRKEGFVGG